MSKLKEHDSQQIYTNSCKLCYITMFFCFFFVLSHSVSVAQNVRRHSTRRYMTHYNNHVFTGSDNGLVRPHHGVASILHNSRSTKYSYVSFAPSLGASLWMVYTEEKHDNKCLRNTLKGFHTTEQNIDTCLTELFRDVTDDLFSSDYF